MSESVGGTGETFVTNRPQQPQNPAVPDGWEIIIGLEVHAELATHTKLFSGSLNEFGGEPNTITYRGLYRGEPYQPELAPGAGSFDARIDMTSYLVYYGDQP